MNRLFVSHRHYPDPKLKSSKKQQLKHNHKKTTEKTTRESSPTPLKSMFVKKPQQSKPLQSKLPCAPPQSKPQCTPLQPHLLKPQYTPVPKETAQIFGPVKLRDKCTSFNYPFKYSPPTTEQYTDNTQSTQYQSSPDITQSTQNPSLHVDSTLSDQQKQQRQRQTIFEFVKQKNEQKTTDEIPQTISQKIAEILKQKSEQSKENELPIKAIEIPQTISHKISELLKQKKETDKENDVVDLGIKTSVLEYPNDYDDFDNHSIRAFNHPNEDSSVLTGFNIKFGDFKSLSTYQSGTEFIGKKYKRFDINPYPNDARLTVKENGNITSARFESEIIWKKKHAVDNDEEIQQKLNEMIYGTHNIDSTIPTQDEEKCKDEMPDLISDFIEAKKDIPVITQLSEEEVAWNNFKTKSKQEILDKATQFSKRLSTLSLDDLIRSIEIIKTAVLIKWDSVKQPCGEEQVVLNFDSNTLTNSLANLNIKLNDLFSPNVVKITKIVDSSTLFSTYSNVTISYEIFVGEIKTMPFLYNNVGKEFVVYKANSLSDLKENDLVWSEKEKSVLLHKNGKFLSFSFSNINVKSKPDDVYFVIMHKDCVLLPENFKPGVNKIKQDNNKILISQQPLPPQPPQLQYNTIKN